MNANERVHTRDMFVDGEVCLLNDVRNFVLFAPCCFACTDKILVLLMTRCSVYLPVYSQLLPYA